MKPHNVTGYITTLARNGDLADWQGHVREQAARRHASQAADNRRTAPPCPHGEPGGDQLNPRSGQPWCPLCRNGVPPDHLDLAATGARAS
ncbi:hypothetical protein AB0H64_42555 [Nonomuraea sp. NPDC050733]|uniref:hypothetical protein n=1 Tax=Nonomuraea sp. NPDC050733 TaxID=3154633 RepID=UPI0033C39B0A